MDKSYQIRLLKRKDRAGGRAVDDVFGNMDKIRGEETQDSGSGSAFSDLSALAEGTDDFGRKLLQHQRDAQRMKALSGGPQKAFSKARPRPRVAEQLEREERETIARAEQELQRPGSDGSNDSNPPVTVPREWGRKARRQPHWMRKIRESSVVSSSDEVERDEDAIYARRVSYTGDENPLVGWDMADHPLQSVENTPPSMRRQRPLSTPSSMNHMNTTLKARSEFEEGDFTAASLLASTPAIRLPRKIDELTRLEIEEIERQAITTRALDHMDGLSPNATRRTSRNSLRDQAIADGMQADQTSPTRRPATAPAAGKTSPSKIPRRPGSGLNNKENLPFSGEANTNFKGTKTTGLSDRTAQAVSIKSTSQHGAQRPGHRRNDSMGLLRRLARVSSSMSPSPARASAAQSDAQGTNSKSAKDSAVGVKTRKDEPIARDKAKDTDSTRPRSQRSALSMEKNIFDDRDQLRVEYDDDRTPMPQYQQQEAKTPVVTGAWVDTTVQGDGDASPVHSQPLATIMSDSHLDPPTAKESARATDNGAGTIKTEPHHPRSALEAIYHQAKHEDNTQQYGDSTMQSLEVIWRPDLEPTDPTITFDLDALKARGQEKDDDEPVLTQDEKDRRQGELAFEALNKHLQAAQTGIKDAGRGLRRVENRIENAEKTEVHDTVAMTAPHTVNVTEEKLHTHCTCGASHPGGAWLALWTEFRSLFYTYDYNPAARYTFLTLRPTWLGLALLLWLTWYFSETTLCSYYCNPLFARYVDRYPDPFAPRYPYVIPTLLFRPLKWLWQPVCNALAWAIGAAFHTLFGSSSTSVRTPSVARSARKASAVRQAWKTATKTDVQSEWMATATEMGSRAMESLFDTVDEAGSMWTDELMS